MNYQVIEMAIPILALMEVWINVNGVSTKIWGNGVPWTHPTLSDGNIVYYTFIYANTNNYPHSVRIDRFISGEKQSYVSGDVPPGSEIRCQVPPLSPFHTVAGAFTVAAVVYVDAVFQNQWCIHWDGATGTLEELDTPTPCTLAPPPCEDYTTQAECEAAGCYWYNEACHSSPEIEFFFPRIREMLYPYPTFARIYDKIDEVRAKKFKVNFFKK